jgi:hypothetical protein
MAELGPTIVSSSARQTYSRCESIFVVFPWLISRAGFDEQLGRRRVPIVIDLILSAQQDGIGGRVRASTSTDWPGLRLCCSTKRNVSLIRDAGDLQAWRSGT